MPKMHHYLALRIDSRRDIANQIWDMLRYDSCYPLPNAPEGWVVLVQPERTGIRGGWTQARWESFGVRFAIYDAAPVSAGINIPINMRLTIESVKARLYSGERIEGDMPHVREVAKQTIGSGEDRKAPLAGDSRPNEAEQYPIRRAWYRAGNIG